MEYLEIKKKLATKARIYIKRILEISITVALCISILKILNYIYVNDCHYDNSSWERVVMNDFYTLDENIDYLYLGSSHLFMDVIPSKMNEINGKNNFNLSTSAQPCMASYYLLKEALKQNKPDHVYLEMYYLPLYSFSSLDNAQVMTLNWYVLNQMPFSFNKLDYACHLANKKYGMMTFFPVRQFARQTFDTTHISSMLNQKKSENYKNCIRILDAYAPFCEKGFCTTMDYVEPGTFQGHTDALPDNTFNGNSKEYLDKIISLCQEEQIELTLFSSPMPDARLCCMGNYDQYITEINSLAEQNGLHYYDFNLCSPKYLDMQYDSNFMDFNHLSYEGAQRFTDVFGEVLLAELEDRPIPEDMFYFSYNEKLRQIDQRIFGLDIQQDTSQEQKTYMLYSIDNLTETEAEFHVTKIRTGESQEVIVQDWSTQNCVSFPETETGVFITEARPIGSKEVTNRVKTEY